jgi:hypothetical protein
LKDRIFAIPYLLVGWTASLALWSSEC